MNKQDAEPGSEENTNKTTDPQGESFQNVNGSKDSKTEKSFVEKKPMPGDEFLSKTE